MQGLVLASIFSVLGGCAGKNINSDLHEDPNILTREWTLPTQTFSGDSGDRGYEYSNPVPWDNTLLFGSRGLGLVSLYPSLLLKRWALPIRGGITSEITVDRGQAYFVGGDGFLYAVSAESGRVIWRYDMHNPTASQPLVDGGRVFVTTTDDTVFALDAGTGKWLWHFRRRSGATATIRSASRPVVVGNEVLSGLSDGFLVALDLNDGQLKWERKLNTNPKFMDVDAEVVVDDQNLYVPSYDGSLYALKKQGGAIVWRFDAGGAKRVWVEGGKVYFPSSDGSIYCLDKNNAKVLWKFSLDGGSPTQLVITDRWVIVGSSYQYLYALDKETGRGHYRYNSGWGTGFSGAPYYDSKARRLYFLSGAGNLYSFTVRSPAPTLAHGRMTPFDFK